ncbi:MAG: glycosyl hydrolase family 18 protein [Bacteroidota bacterium]|nr:glycosyl hydrolase family 18 protein [Bacteroidota bacterium]
MKKTFSKFIKIICFLISGIVILQSCKKEIAKDPVFGTGDYPRIFYLGNQFPASVIINQGDTAIYNNLKFSPAGKVTINWYVNDAVASHDTLFKFIPTTGGEFKIKLEAVYNGLKSIRTSEVVVKPATYTRKIFPKVLLGYLSANGVATDVNWNAITHLAVQVGQVSADGSLDITRGNSNQLMDELVARGHNRGIPVMLSIYGRLTPVDGWALYGSDDMGPVLRDPGKRDGLIAQLKDYVTKTKLDGVDIIFTDFNGAASYSASLAALKPMIDGLKTALPANSIVTLSVTTGWQHWEYPDLSNADWVNVHAYEDGVHVGPGAPTGQASSFDYMKTAAGIWQQFHLPASKIVVGFPVFGLRYNQLDASGNNLSWGSYDYVTYKDILAIDPTADSKEFINSASGIHYNGVSLIKQKADYIKASDFKGMYGWYLDADSKDSTKSLFTTAFKSLN